MKDCYVSGKSVVVLITVIVSFVALLEPSVFAQGGSRPFPVSRRIEEMNRQGEQYERDAQSKDLKGKAENRVDPRRTKEIIAQVSEDFERIQDIYNKIVIAMSSNRALDYGLISEAAAEVKKRANRLKSNLALPQPKDDEKSQKKQDELDQPDDEQMKTLLLAFRNHIASFVTNPLFEFSNALDVELSIKASHDLKRIIELSDSIKKSADKLKKSK
jgi:hypothetical protein